MINWFGPESWDAPICRETPRCETPVGIPCMRCALPIGDTDSGVTMPAILHNLSEGVITFHLACHLKSVLPHTLWPAVQLVPNDADGLVDGRFECSSCGMVYSVHTGWMRRLV